MDEIEPGEATQPRDHECDLIDLSGLSVEEVLRLKPTVLTHSLQRILDEIDNPQDAVAGWQSAL